MYFMVNKTVVNYIDHFDNLTDSLDAPLILMDKTTFQHTLSISLIASKLDSTLLTGPPMLKDFVQQYCKQKEIFDLEERHIIMVLEMSNKIPFSIILLQMFFCSLLW